MCFYKLANAALDARPGRTQIVTDVGNFPTDRYVLEGLARARGIEIVWLDGEPHPDDVAARLGPDTALVTFSHVSYRSAHIADMAAINQIAEDAGALMLWDLSHSAGSVPVSLDGDHAPLAVGCTYKYLNGGPGAPAYMYVSRELQSELRQPIWGWLGRRDPFEMAPGYEVAEGHARLPVGHAAGPGAVRGRRGRPADRRGRDRGDPGQGRRPDRVRHRAGRRAAGGAWRVGGLAARPGQAGRARGARASERARAVRTADRGRRDPRLPPART